MPPTRAQANYFRKELVKELRRVESLMKKEQSVEKKIYYLSAAYGITSRTFRYSFSSDVLLADFALNTAYGLLLDRFNHMRAGEQAVKIEDWHFEKICEGLRLLAERFEAMENIQEPLELIVTAAFCATGPGNYLFEKGEIEL